MPVATADYLEKQYNLRLAHPEGEGIKARWQSRSAEARARLPHERDLPALPYTSTRLDLFKPAAGPPGSRLPCFIFLHGGFWRSGDKADCSLVALGLAEAGMATAVLNYPLLPETALESILEDLRASVTFLHTNAGELGLDAQRFFVGGHSAGAHLAAWLLATDWRGRGLPVNTLAGGMGLSGVYDPRPVRATSHNEQIQLSPDQAKAASALRVSRGAPPLDFLACGSAETAGFKRQSQRYRRLAERRTGRTCPLLWLSGRNHYDALLDFATATSSVSQATIATMHAL